MSNFTTIYGYIEEFLPLHQENWESYRAANDQTLQALPIDDSFPPLCRAMVAATGPDSAHGSYRRRLFHLGGSFNDILPDLPAWLKEFLTPRQLNVIEQRFGLTDPLFRPWMKRTRYWPSGAGTVTRSKART